MPKSPLMTLAFLLYMRGALPSLPLLLAAAKTDPAILAPLPGRIFVGGNNGSGMVWSILLIAQPGNGAGALALLDAPGIDPSRAVMLVQVPDARGRFVFVGETADGRTLSLRIAPGNVVMSRGATIFGYAAIVESTDLPTPLLFGAGDFR